MRLYVDTSALLRRVLVGDDHAAAAEQALAAASSNKDRLTSSILAVTEIQRALRARRARGNLPPGFDIAAASAAALSGIEVVAITAEVTNLAANLEPDLLRSLDAIHLASAILDHCDSIMTYDERQAEAALLNGLSVITPE